MRMTQLPFAAALLALASPVWSIALPPTEDTFSKVTVSATGTVIKTALKPANGAKPTLPVSVTSHALIRFGVANSAVSAPGVTRATLTIFLPVVTAAGDLDVSLVTSDWHESFTGAPVAEPTSATVFSTIPAAAVVKKQFIKLDVTDQVKNWLNSPGSDFGVVISSPDGVAKVAISSKEGSGTGYPATLEIETNGALASGAFSFPGNIGIGTETPAHPLDVAGTGDFLLSLNQTGNGSAGILQTNPNHSYFTGIFGGNNRWSISDMSSTPVERLTVLANGNVGIGTSAPGYQLEISSDNQTQLALTSTSTNGRTWSLQSSNGDAALGDGTFQIVDRKAGAARLVITKGGNAGIGTPIESPPTAKLDVRGDIKFGATGQLSATGGEEKLRIVRGEINSDDFSIIAGSGFTFTRNLAGNYLITFSTPFTSKITMTLVPSALGTLGITSCDQQLCVVFTTTPAGAPKDSGFSFIAVGGQ